MSNSFASSNPTSAQTVICPNCHKEFELDAAGYAAIVYQVRDAEFRKEILAHDALCASNYASQLEAALAAQREELAAQSSAKDQEIALLKERLSGEQARKQAEIQLAVNEQETALIRLRSQYSQEQAETQKRELALRQQHAMELQLKDEQIAQLRDFKARLSTKAIGESLEQHCQDEFNRWRKVAFPTAYFEKDNDAGCGSKGDFIFRDTQDGIEYISIMFEMKNEMEATVTKHKNEDFFQKLDKDRQEKHCEYAVLVSTLEADSDYYNAGIVDVSHKYPKMFVVRPQCFLAIIALLRNAALDSLEYRKQLVEAQQKEVDITNFENALNEFKSGCALNYDRASKKFDEAMEGIDKAIAQLEKIKSAFSSAKNNMRLLSDKAESLSIKKLTKKNPTMRAKFLEAGTEIK